MHVSMFTLLVMKAHRALTFLWSAIGYECMYLCSLHYFKIHAIAQSTVAFRILEQ